MKNNKLDQEDCVAIVFIGDLMYCPYLKYYTEILDTNKIKYDVYYWNRSGEKQFLEKNYYAYEKKSMLKKNMLFKAVDFIGYRNWLKRKIKRGNYKKTILLSTLSAMILFPYVLKIKGKYIFDIRDYSYELFKLYYLVEKRIINNAGINIVSSSGFKAFLPKAEYMIAHNFSVTLEEKNLRHELLKPNKKITLVWMGALRYFEHQTKIIEALADDDRFELIYHGEGPSSVEFREYNRLHPHSNVRFTGRYDNDQKRTLLSKASILNNSYSEHYETKYALSNKFYDGAFYHIPQLVECGSYKQDLVDKYNIGIALDVNDPEFANKLYEYYFTINKVEFDNNCNELIELVNKEQTETRSRIIEFLLHK